MRKYLTISMQLYMKPSQKWEILHIDWCRISSINSMAPQQIIPGMSDGNRQGSLPLWARPPQHPAVNACTKNIQYTSLRINMSPKTGLYFIRKIHLPTIDFAFFLVTNAAINQKCDACQDCPTQEEWQVNSLLKISVSFTIPGVLSKKKNPYLSHLPPQQAGNALFPACP